MTVRLPRAISLSCAMLSVLALVLHKGAAASPSVAACLSHETIAVLASTSTATIDRENPPHSQEIAILGATQDDLRQFGAGIVSVPWHASSDNNLESLPYSASLKMGATMLLLTQVSTREYRLTSPYLQGDQYPLRTVKLIVAAWVIDPHSREVLASLQWPENTSVRNSSDEAIADWVRGDRSQALAKIMSSACETRRTTLVSASGDAPSPQQSRLLQYRDLAKSICDTVKEARGKKTDKQIEGDIHGTLSGVIGKFADIGGSGKGSISQEEFEGLSRDATAEALSEDRGCREREFNKLLDKLGAS